MKPDSCSVYDVADFRLKGQRLILIVHYLLQAVRYLVTLSFRKFLLEQAGVRVSAQSRGYSNRFVGTGPKSVQQPSRVQYRLVQVKSPKSVFKFSQKRRVDVWAFVRKNE